MKSLVRYSIILLCAWACSSDRNEAKRHIAEEMESVLRGGMLEKWYPQSIDTMYGGFLSTFTFDFKPTGDQDKMIVTQARHTWTNAKAWMRYPGVAHYERGARHGFEFLRTVMWDSTHGGFYQLVDRRGDVKEDEIPKTAYGNAFGIYALAAYYHASHDERALDLAKKTFRWLEDHSHDTKLKGYFQHLRRNGDPIPRGTDTPSTSDLGYKDQNSSIHLLEAFSELYQVWPDDLLRRRLEEMLFLIRDRIVNQRGNLVLFFQTDWTPVSFADSSEDAILKHHNLDHVSFGHDIETAFLLLEASYVLGRKNDTTTLRVARKMVDQALLNGWDSNGGFYDEGYYFKGKSAVTILRDTKNWWTQSEALNSLLMMSDLYPDSDRLYFEKFKTQWEYCKKYLYDPVHGDFYPGGLDKQPEMKTANKGHIWKAMYHQYRSLDNCIQRLRGKAEF